MTRSMTGFGKADCAIDGESVSVEVSSVNHRFLDCTVRMPYAWAALEPVVKDTVRKRVSRGKVNVTVNRKRGTAPPRQTVLYDADLARQYVDASKELVRVLGSMETLSLNVLAQMEGVFYHEEAEDDIEKVQTALVRGTEAALDRLDAMRATEGKALTEELMQRVDLMRESLAAVEARVPELNVLYEQRLRARVAELAADAALNEERLAIEVAFMADKGDVTEEIVRLKTHFEHTLELLARNEPVGRDLNFLTQELQREINTLGSKVRDGDVTKEVLRMKSELERLREQVQNIE